MGGWRAIGSSVKYLPELGWQPIVLSAADTVRYPKDYSSLKKVPADIEVHRVGHWERRPLIQRAIDKLRLNIDFPDSFKWWYGPALQEARKIVEEQNIDLVFSYGPPHAAHFIAMQLKKEFDIPWVVCFSDLWSGNTYNAEKLIRPLGWLQIRRIKWTERQFLQIADKIIVRSWHHQDYLCALYKMNENDIKFIKHGYDEDEYINLRPYRLYPDNLTITYMGSFYSEYQQTFLTFWQILQDVIEDVELVFVGQGNIPDVSNQRLTRILYVPQEKAMAFGMGSDFLLLIQHPSAKWIVMKLYDYLRLGKPILALVPEDGGVARIIREARAGFVLSYEPEQMKQQLKTIFDNYHRGELKEFQPDQDYIARLERRNITEHIVQIFNGVSP